MLFIVLDSIGNNNNNYNKNKDLTKKIVWECKLLQNGDKLTTRLFIFVLFRFIQFWLF